MPLILCRIVGSVRLFQITGKLTPECVELIPNILQDFWELEWNEVNMILNKLKVKFPTSVKIPLKGKFKVRRILRRDPLLLKQGMTWFCFDVRGCY